MLFSSIKFYAANNVDQKTIDQLKANGGTQFEYLCELLTVVLCDDPICGEFVEARDLFNLPVVSENWVSLSFICNKLLSFDCFRVDEKNVFRGLTVAAAHVGKDRDRLWALLTFHGAKTSSIVTRNTTHLVTCYPPTNLPDRVHVVTPNWVVDSVRATCRLSEKDYLPELLQRGPFIGLVFYGDLKGDVVDKIQANGGSICHVCLSCATHVVAHSQDHIGTAINQGKRIISVYWILDCIALGRLLPPWKAIHFPLPFTDYRPCCGQIISTTGFTGQEKKYIILMIQLLGAIYTDCLTSQNSVLIFNTLTGSKVEKAMSVDIAVVNPLWLSDLMLGYLDALKLPVKDKYKSKMDNIYDFTPSLVQHVSVGWNSVVSKFPTVRPSEVKRILITFTGVDEGKVFKLKNMAASLGAFVAQEAGRCTHIVADRLVRSLKFLCAINHCTHVVTSQWIEDSSQIGCFKPEDPYILNDPANEEKFKCSLSDILSRVSRGRLFEVIGGKFEGLRFHVTPNVIPDVEALKPIIINAGGFYLRDIPTCYSDRTFIISCDRDISLVSNLIKGGMHVYSPELILSSVFAQKLIIENFVL